MYFFGFYIKKGDLRVGDNAPDSNLVSIVDQSSHQLLEFVPSLIFSNKEHVFYYSN